MDSSLNCILLYALNINDNNVTIIIVDLFQILIKRKIFQILGFNRFVFALNFKAAFYSSHELIVQLSSLIIYIHTKIFENFREASLGSIDSKLIKNKTKRDHRGKG